MAELKSLLMLLEKQGWIFNAVKTGNLLISKNVMVK